MIKIQTFLNFALLSSTVQVYANEHIMTSLVNDVLGSLPSRGAVPDLSGILRDIDQSKASMPEGRGLVRVLQDTANCNASRFENLLLDPTLNETFTAYSNNFDAANSGATIEDCQTNGNLVTCPFQQTIDGEAEYQSACMAAGGQIEPIPGDLACDTTDPDGNDITFYVDRPSFLLCLPGASDDFDDSCVESIRDAIETELNAKAFLIQQALIASGIVTDASCQVTDEAPSAPSGAAKNGIGLASMTMVVMSLITGFHYY